MDAWSNFWTHNKPLYDQMIAKGFTFKRGKQNAHFVDTNGEYVSFPRGYITGVGYSDNGTPTPYFASICLGDSWAQRSFKTYSEAIDWAKGYAIELGLADEPKPTKRHIGNNTRLTTINNTTH